MILALVHKALKLCNSTQCRGHNIRGLVLGFGYKHYKWEWWYMPLTCRLRALHLEPGGGDPSVLDANYPPN